MAIDVADSTSTPSSFRRQWDVFLSFRGEDTRDGITTSLYRSLVGKGVRVFLDDVGLNRGDEIERGLLEAIEDSAAFIVILSKNYASSHWCLEELARICELRRRSLIPRLVLPVFYEVDPSHVRKQIGPFVEAFFCHENKFGKDKANEWREAMANVGSLAGFVLRDMGRQIVQDESFSDPGMRSRLWDHDEIVTVLKNHKGARRIQGIVVNMKKADNDRKQVIFGTKSFESMVNLRLLRVNHVNLEGKFKFLPRELKWLQWHGCALDTLPSDFCPQKLAVVDLSDGKIKQLWSSNVNKVAENLKVMNLSYCAHLASLPDLSRHGKLEKIVLKNCVALTKIHKSVGMKNLQTLVLSDCSKLKELPEGIGSMRSLKELYVDHTGIDKLPESIYRLQKLEKLILYGCIRIKRLPTCVGMLVSLKELRLNHSALEKLPDSVGSLENLERLSLISCESLTVIPDTIGNLKLLKELLIKGSAITELPNSIGNLSYLKSLFVGGKNISKLPDSFRGLSSAVKLDIADTSITRLPSYTGELTLLEKIEIRNCISLEYLPESTGSLFALTYMNIYNAGITVLPESFGMLENLITLRLNQCRKLHKLPSSMGNLKSLHRLYMKETAVKELPETFGMLTSRAVNETRQIASYSRSTRSRLDKYSDRIDSTQTRSTQVLNELK
ncbi:5-formyltetrahydrofolate cyclo-ligase-like isoform X1 [Hibiscus syriacus]|uniref:5-formyltetrahydrofolate cyclo-ligase-like isoform X1 n=1 Tax=Hibiscus syriacus TaxID=106335 RepID=A0A6A2Z9K6_HIBSY|nr:5-formyltetrahydrofolate cyclo-ligase-like isoform X1 [Hibiscus syriacus]